MSTECYAVVCQECGQLNSELMPKDIAEYTKKKHRKYSYHYGCDYVDVVMPENATKEGENVE